MLCFRAALYMSFRDELVVYIEFSVLGKHDETLNADILERMMFDARKSLHTAAARDHTRSYRRPRQKPCLFIFIADVV